MRAFGHGEQGILTCGHLLLNSKDQAEYVGGGYVSAQSMLCLKYLLLGTNEKEKAPKVRQRPKFVVN